jgi:hypothetical protein
MPVYPLGVIRIAYPVASLVAFSTVGAASCGDCGSNVTDTSQPDCGTRLDADAGSDADSGGRLPDSGSVIPPDAGTIRPECVGDAGRGGCYALTCPGARVHTLQENQDRLIADLAARRCTDSCRLWAALNQAERYVFIMDTAYFGAPASLLYPPAANNRETALDHATALYSINGPMAGQGVDGSGRGGNDYNRCYFGFDALAECVMRDFAIANPIGNPAYNLWVTSDDLAGPHAPFTQREMIFWYKAWYDLQSNGPQFHHWHQDSDFSQSGINLRLGVCGVSDRSLVESTIAFDFYHNSDPLGDYSGRGGYGWQIVDQYVGIVPNWDYMPTGCPNTPPVNTDPYGGGTFAGMGPSLAGDVCGKPTFDSCP